MLTNPDPRGDAEQVGGHPGGVPGQLDEPEGRRHWQDPMAGNYHRMFFPAWKIWRAMMTLTLRQ